MKALTTAIFSKLSGSTLSADIGGRLFKHEAPEGAEYPYAVYMVVSNTPEYPGGKTIEKYLVQFSLFSAASGSTEVEDMLTHLRTLYDDCTLTIIGNTSIYFVRGNFSPMREEHTTPAGTVGVWHYMQEYNGWMVKT